MDIQVESVGDSRIIRIKDKITLERCAAFQEQVEKALGEGVREVVFDFKDVPFMDSSGVGEILRIFRMMRDREGEVVLVNPNHKLRALFLMYRFDKFMKIRDESDTGKE
jgi:anti-sigma B factor antagonist